MKPNSDVYMSGEFYFLSYELTKHMFQYYDRSNGRSIPFSADVTTSVVEKHEDLIIGTMVMRSTTSRSSLTEDDGNKQQQHQQAPQRSVTQLHLINIRRMDSLWIHDYELTKSMQGFQRQYMKHIYKY